MEAKLIKDGDGYWLDISDDGITKRPLTDFGQLSIKNCEAIERGYDLDEIKRKLFGGFDGQPDSFTVAAVERTVEIMFEILGDKKFSEEDMLSFESFVSKWYDKAKDIEEFTALPSELLVKWKSLQQTEWDVEIVTKPYTEVGEGFELELKREPKLDKDGCLILRRK